MGKNIQNIQRHLNKTGIFFSLGFYCLRAKMLYYSEQAKKDYLSIKYKMNNAGLAVFIKSVSFQSNSDAQKQKEDNARCQTEAAGKVPAKSTDQTQKVSHSTPSTIEGVVASEKHLIDEVQKKDSDNTVNGEVKSKPNQNKTVINNSVPLMKTTSHVFLEKKDKDFSSKSLTQLNPLGKS